MQSCRVFQNTQEKIAMIFIKKYYPLFLLLLALIFSRIFQLSKYPPILNRDEAALAYNAKLILESGKDEWGKRFPLQFQSFGDYKLPGYIYFLVPLFAVFGESDYVVRLPSAMAGVGIVLIGALLFFNLFSVKKSKLKFLTLSIFLIITPVLFFYSRMAWEANLSLFFLLTSIYLVVKKVKRRLFLDILSAIFMLLAVFTYNIPLLLLPFLIFVIIFDRGFYQVKSWIVPVVFWTSVMFFGFLIFFSVTSQKTGITIFSDETTSIQYPIYRQQFAGSFQTALGNKYVYWSKIIVSNYLATFSPKFLVTSGGSHPWHSILGRGHVYWVEYFFFIFGSITLAYQSIKNILAKKLNTVKGQITSLYLLIISPLPAVVTVDAPHATRSLFALFMIVLISVYGLFYCLSLIKKRSFKYIFSFLLCLIVMIEGSLYFYQYFNIWPRDYPQQLNVGFDQVVKRADSEYADNDKVVIDDEGYLYINTAWYSKMPASKFFTTQQKHLPDKIGLRYGYRVGSYRFIKSINDRMNGENVILQNTNGEWKVEKY